MFSPYCVTKINQTMLAWKSDVDKFNRDNLFPSLLEDSLNT